jgi:hypothetical protein
LPPADSLVTEDRRTLFIPQHDEVEALFQNISSHAQTPKLLEKQ